MDRETIDRIVPALEPVSEEYVGEWAMWKDRERIRRELFALSAPTGEDEGLIRQLWELAGVEPRFGYSPDLAVVARAAQRLSVLLGGGDSSSSSESARAEPHSSALTEAQSQAGGERLLDKIEGLECDLREAVRVAARRGAMEWARLNYPKWHAELMAEMKSQRETAAMTPAENSLSGGTAKPTIPLTVQDDLPPQNPTGGEPG